jgi:hypothetical protein
MSNYNKATNFATKDTLPSGDPNKIVKGTEINNEFNAIASAITSKADLASPTFTGVPAAPTATAGSNTTQLANTAYVKNAMDSLGTMSTQNANAVAITGGTISGLSTPLPVASGGTSSATLTANNVLLGNGTSALQTVAPGTVNNVLTSNGTTWISSAPIIRSSGQIFTSSGTFTIPANVLSLKAIVIGGGGSGGEGDNSGIGWMRQGDGGGSGGSAIKFLTGLTPGNTLTVTVGGVGGTSTVASGTQTITSIVCGGGGEGGPGNAQTPAPGAGGTATGGDLNVPGQIGQSSSGGSIIGLGGYGAQFGVFGKAAYAYGGAGGGSGVNSGDAGFAGKQGIIVFEW